jgi:dTMP kinase
MSAETEDDAGPAAAAAARGSGVYITVEGIDGSGKSTVAERLADELGAVLVSEPDDTVWTGEAARAAMRSETGPYTDALLLMADRAEHLHRRVLPALRRGETVVSDRGGDSTHAYQSMRVDCPEPLSWFDAVMAPWDVRPDMTLWLDCPVDEALSRLGPQGDPYERREVLEHAAGVYAELAAREPSRFVRVDASLDPDEVRRRCLDAALEVVRP